MQYVNQPFEALSTLTSLALPQLALFLHCVTGCVLRPQTTIKYTSTEEGRYSYCFRVETRDRRRRRRRRRISMEEETSMKQRAVPAIRATTSRPLKKVQVVYYLTRNGHLEHPHYMEVSLLHHHQLRLQGIVFG